MAIKTRPNLINPDQLNLAKEKAKRDTMKEYNTMIGKRSRTFYEARLKAYCDAFNILATALA